MSIKINWFLFIIVCTSILTITRSHRRTHKSFIIMLNPAGNARHTGRTIGNGFERGITLQYAEQIKKELEQAHQHVTVLLTRSPGDIVYALQNASLANRLDVDLFISIHFYQSHEIKPKIHLYQFSYNDDFIQKTSALSFCPYDQAHLLHSDTTNTWVDLIQSSCNKTKYQKLFEMVDSYKLPFKPLIGVTAPSIGIEAGLKEKDDWRNYITPLVDGIHTIINHI